MKFGGLLTAVIILAALGGGVYWSNKAKEAADKAPPKDAAPKVLTPEIRKVNESWRPAETTEREDLDKDSSLISRVEFHVVKRPGGDVTDPDDWRDLRRARMRPEQASDEDLFTRAELERLEEVGVHQGVDGVVEDIELRMIEEPER